jgi:hypothetical protein
VPVPVCTRPTRRQAGSDARLRCSTVASAYSYRPTEGERCLQAARSIPSCAAGAELSEEVIATLGQDAVRNMQQALSNQGHYRGRVDGVMGLRTRESIRAFQRTQNLPATGQIDPQTAHKLGITQDCELATRTAHDVAKGKPWAGTRVVKPIKGPAKTLPHLSLVRADGSFGNALWRVKQKRGLSLIRL